MSNIKKVLSNAKKFGYDPDNVFISDKPEKKFYYLHDGKKIYFGSSNYEDFTKHQDEDRRRRYLARATAIKGDWQKNKFSPNNLAINLLWN